MARAAPLALDPDALFAALAEPTRLRLVALLLGGERCVCDLYAALERPQPVVSRHLGVLRRAGLVEARRAGAWMWYRLAPAHSPLHQCLLDAAANAAPHIPGLRDHEERCRASLAARGCC